MKKLIALCLMILPAGIALAADPASGNIGPNTPIECRQFCQPTIGGGMECRQICQ